MKRTASYVAAATLTFLIGVAFALLRLPQWQDKQSRPRASPAKAHADVNSAKGSRSSESDPLLQEVKFPRVWSTTVTAAGKVEVVESDFLTWKVYLNGKELLSSDDDDGSLPPGVLKHVRSRAASFDEVIVLSQDTGTCCEFGRFWFLGLKADGSYLLSDAIGDGFAHAPEVLAEGDHVKVKIRSGYGRHEVGLLRGGTWMLKNGKVTKQR